MEQEIPETQELTEEVKKAVRAKELIEYGPPEKLPAGPHVPFSDSIIVVEGGRADVLNLLKHGIKNAIAVEGTSVPETIIKLSKERIVTAFTDGDRGGELILKELLQVADVDYVARAPPEGKEVEELTKKEIVKSLRSKVPAEQVITEIFYKGRNFYDVIREKEREKKKEEHAEVKSHAPASTQVQHAVKAKERKPQSELQSEERIIKPIGGSKSGEFHGFEEFIERVKTSNESTALLLDKDRRVIAEIPVRELTNRLRERKDVHAVVFNGVITQRLIDTVSESGVKYLVGARKYNVVRRPINLKIVTFAE